MYLKKRLKIDDKGLYLFTFIAVTVVFLKIGQNIWAETVAEFMKYSLGEKLTESFGGYITIFTILSGYIYYLFVSWTNISWFEFSSFISYIYTLICLMLVVKVLSKKLNKRSIVIIIISILAVLAHPSSSALINITHIGYIPVILYIMTCVFKNDNWISDIANMPKLLFVPLIISMFSKPSFSCVIFLVILIFTKVYKKPITFIVLLASTVISLLQMILYSNGEVSLRIDGIKSLFKFIYIFIQAIGNSLLFLFTYYIDGEISKTILIVSIIIGICVVTYILYITMRKIEYKSFVLLLLLGSMIITSVMPYVMLDCSIPLESLAQESAKLCFGKYKLQYQITSVTIIISMIMFFINYSIDKYKIKNVSVGNGIIFLMILLSINGLFCGLYSGSWQTVNEIEDKNLKYNSEEVFMYPPLPDWDWSWSDNAIGGWIKGQSYSKYNNKPDTFGGEFRNLNHDQIPQIDKGKIFIMLSDPNINKMSPKDYLNIFKEEYRESNFFIDDLKIHLSKPTDNGIRYGVIDYSSDIANKLFNDNFDVIDEFNKVKLKSSNVNFIIVY
ncbi:hypothetical protein EXN19_06475 [Clostridium butyricum]|nr:hypothetical protein [Clostridium butyricum]